MVDIGDLKSPAFGRAGSSPAAATKVFKDNYSIYNSMSSRKQRFDSSTLHHNLWGVRLVVGQRIMLSCFNNERKIMKNIVVEYRSTNDKEKFLDENSSVLSEFFVIWVHNPNAEKIVIYSL